MAAGCRAAGEGVGTSDPKVAIFHEAWGRAGDTVLVAAENGRLIGAVWYRFFNEAEHGDGYVDEETPEIAIAVIDGIPSSQGGASPDGGDARAGATRRATR